MSTYAESGDRYLPVCPDWEPIEDTPVTFDNVLATASMRVIDKIRIDGCDSDLLLGKSLFWQRSDGRW